MKNWRFRKNKPWNGMLCGRGSGPNEHPEQNVCIGDHYIDDHDDFHRGSGDDRVLANGVYVDRFVYDHPWISLFFRRLTRYRGSRHTFPTFWGSVHYMVETDAVDVMPIPFNVIVGIPRKFWRWFKYGVR